MRRVWSLAFLLLCVLVFLVPHRASASNTHGQPDVSREQQAWFGDAMNPYMVSGCLPAVSATLTLPAFACNGYVQGSAGELVYVSQSAQAVGPLTCPNTCWLALHRDTTTAVAGWTRQVGSHYLWRDSASRPSAPASGVIIGQVTVAAGAIPVVRDLRVAASMVRSGKLEVTDQLYGAVCDGVIDDSAALQALVMRVKSGGVPLVVPSQTTCVYGTTLNADDSVSLRIEGLNTVTGGAQPTSVLRYTGTGTALSAKSANGLLIQNLYITGFTVDATHFLIDTQHSAAATDSAYVRLYNNYLHVAATSGGVVNFDKTISSTIQDNHIVNGVFGIRGAATSGSYANAISVLGNTFHNNQYALQNAAESWAVINNTFEGNGANFLGAYINTGGHCATNALLFQGNWLGDSPATTDWLDICGSFTAQSNMFSSGRTGVIVRSSNPANMRGNTYGTGVTGLVVPVGFPQDQARVVSENNLVLAGAADHTFNGIRPYAARVLNWEFAVGNIIYRALRVLYDGVEAIYLGPLSLAGTNSTLYLMTNGTGEGLLRNQEDNQDVLLAGGSTLAKQARIRLSPVDKDGAIHLDVANDRQASITVNGLIAIGKANETIVAGATITANACGGVKQISSTGAVSTSATDAFTVPTALPSCIMHVCNTGGFIITLKRSAAFFAQGGADVALASSCCLTVVNFGSIWSQATAVQCSS